MKWLVYLILTLLVVGSFLFYQSSSRELETLEEKKSALQKVEDRDEDVEDQINAIQRAITDKSNERTLKGILMTFFSAGLIGIVVVTQLLPIMAHRLTHAVYDSGEMVERDPMHDAHSLVAQGDYVGAVAAFKTAAAADPYNRLPWVEIAKIQRINLENPEAAIATLRTTLEGQEWPVNDAAYFLFRLAELYDEDRHDRTNAAAILHQVIDEFPETRHSANARHKLSEWKLA